MNDTKLHQLKLVDLKKLYNAGFITFETLVYALPLKILFDEFPELDGNRVAACWQNLRDSGVLSREGFSPLATLKE